MQTDSPTKITQLFEKQDLKSGLQLILNKANHLKKIESLLYQVLTDELVAHCHVMNLKSHTLVLAIDNAAFATQLRYQQMTLLNQLKQFSELQDINKIEYKVRPKYQVQDNTPIAKGLSVKTRELISATISHISHPKLKAALQRLVEN